MEELPFVDVETSTSTKKYVGDFCFGYILLMEENC